MTAMSYDLKILSADSIDTIQPLWENLNAIHADVSRHFSDQFKDMSFAKRKQALLHRAETCELRFFVIQETVEPCAFLAATVDPNKHGHIESLYVSERCRGKQMGDTLMRAVLEWFSAAGTTSTSVNVIHGNEAAHPFYAKYGFLPRSMTLCRHD